ncbi:hypothetical protein Tco_0450638 [Tanacetum coccineum]
MFKDLFPVFMVQSVSYKFMVVPVLVGALNDSKQSSPKEKEGEAKSTAVAAVSTTDAASTKKPIVELRPNWDSVEPLDLVDLTELFSDDARPRPPSKPRPAKKLIQK